MTEQNFDRHLKKVLENLEPPYDPSSWAQLQQRLEAREAATADEALWDANVRQKLERVGERYDAAAWRGLLAKMREKAQRRYVLYIAKTIEAALLLLLLSNVERLEDHPSGLPKPVFHQPGSGASAEKNEHLPIPARAPEAASASAAPTTAAASTLLAEVLEETRATAITREVVPETASANDLLQTEVEIKKVPTLPGLAFASVHSTIEEPFAVGAALPLLPVEPSRKKSAYLLCSGSWQQNRLHTGHTVRGANTYGFSLRAEYRHRRWAWGWGLEYTDFAFEPLSREHFFQGSPHTGYYTLVLSQVRADVLALPLSVSHRFFNATHWQGWITGGLTTHMALTEAYDYDYRYYPPGQLPSVQLDPNAQPHLRQRGAGLLERGGGDNDLFISADFGLRWEYGAPESRYGVFLQPLYSRGLSAGIGPERARRHAWILLLGMRLSMQ